MSLSLERNPAGGSIPPRYSEPKAGRLFPFLLLLPAVFIAAVILYAFDPAHSGFYPTCLFYRTTGLLCPGCGSLRAGHQLLHGNLAAAFRFNALLILSLPAAATFALWRLFPRARTRPFLGPAWLWWGAIILLAFGVLRNLPGAARYGLAP